ncbi:MAG: hypothetical protein ACE3JN_14135 [Ectobacillus sp.]
MERKAATPAGKAGQPRPCTERSGLGPARGKRPPVVGNQQSSLTELFLFNAVKKQSYASAPSNIR